MADEWISTRSWASVYAHYNTSQGKWHTKRHHDSSRANHKDKRVGGGPIPGNPQSFPEIAGILLPLVRLWKYPLLCQGCILSPCLFNLDAEYIMRKPGLDESQAGIKFARRNSNKFINADDNILIAENGSSWSHRAFWWKWKRRVKKLV